MVSFCQRALPVRPYCMVSNLTIYYPATANNCWPWGSLVGTGRLRQVNEQINRGHIVANTSPVAGKTKVVMQGYCRCLPLNQSTCLPPSSLTLLGRPGVDSHVWGAPVPQGSWDYEVTQECGWYFRRGYVGQGQYWNRRINAENVWVTMGRQWAE